MTSIPGILRHANDTRNHPRTRSTTCLFCHHIHHVDPLMVVINTVYRYLPATRSHGRFSCVGASVQAIFVPARTSSTTCDRLHPLKDNLSAQFAGQWVDAASARMTSSRVRQAVCIPRLVVNKAVRHWIRFKRRGEHPTSQLSCYYTDHFTASRLAPSGSSSFGNSTRPSPLVPL